jgi:hypothetical protein
MMSPGIRATGVDAAVGAAGLTIMAQPVSLTMKLLRSLLSGVDGTWSITTRFPREGHAPRT